MMHRLAPVSLGDDSYMLCNLRRYLWATIYDA